MDDHPVMAFLPSNVYSAFIQHTGEGYYGDKSAAILADLAKQWMAATKAAPCPWLDDADIETAIEFKVETKSETEVEAPAEVDASRGYQWKRLFLPNGTELRTIYCGRSLYATVENEQIICDGLPTTPSRLANAQGCGTRNAWKTIWLRFPGEKRWELAARCRNEKP